MLPGGAAPAVLFVGLVLPDDILDELLLFCDIRSVGRIAVSSRRFSTFVANPNRRHWRLRLCWLLGVPPAQEKDVVIETSTTKESSSSICSLLKIAIEEFPSRCINNNNDNSLPEEKWMKERGISLESIGWNMYQLGRNNNERTTIDTVYRMEEEDDDEDVCAICNFHRISRQPTTVIRRCRRDGSKLGIQLSSLYYFEIRLVERSSHGRRNTVPARRRPYCVSIGLCTENFPTSGYQPGWTPHGIGYHGDDGRIHHHGSSDSYGPTFGTGDVVGCGFHLPSKSVFFTKNGFFIGTAITLIDPPVPHTKPLLPVIGLDSNDVTVIVNFGGTDEPYAFNVTVAEQLYEQYPPQRRWGNVKENVEQQQLKHLLLNCLKNDCNNNDFHPWNDFTKRVSIADVDDDLWNRIRYESDSDSDIIMLLSDTTDDDDSDNDHFHFDDHESLE